MNGKEVKREWKWWGINQSKVLVGELKGIGVDLIDVSSGGIWEKESVEPKPGYNVCVKFHFSSMSKNPHKCAFD